MTVAAGCDAKIRPFRPVNEVEIQCERAAHGPLETHTATLRNYAYPGSETVMSWADSDRRSFSGEFVPCSVEGCILPANHRGNDAF